MRHKTKKTKFEAFSQRFLVISMVIFVFGIIGVKSMESSYNRTAQVLEKEIKIGRASCRERVSSPV